MFLFCHIKEKRCGFCGEYRGDLYCGIAKGENKINKMNKCPYKPRKK